MAQPVSRGFGAGNRVEPISRQIECWFSILSRAALKGASFTLPAELRDAIDRFIEAHNETAEPFEWTTAEVHPVSPKRYIANLRR